MVGGRCKETDEGGREEQSTAKESSPARDGGMTAQLREQGRFEE